MLKNHGGVCMKRYDGKNAWWFNLLFLLYNLLPLILLYPKNTSVSIFMVIIFIFYYAFDFIWIPILVKNHVDLYDDYFLFYYGFSKRKVFLNELKKVEKRRDIIASSANSLDRIYIDTQDGDFMISLKENDEFIEAITVRNNYT